MTTYTDYSAVASATTPAITPPIVERQAALRLFMLRPRLVFAARINMPSVSYPVTSLIYDGVTAGSFADVVTDLLLTLGSTPGGDDLGRTRVKNLASSVHVPVGRLSEGLEDGTLTVVDNAYLSVWEDYRIFSKIPYIDDAGTMYKDADITVGTYNDAPPPVCNIGSGVGDTIDATTGLITVAFDASLSLVMAPGATLVSYAWNLQGGVVIAGALDEATLTATFTAGWRWVSCTVTDSNGRSHSALVMVVARDPANDICIDGWQLVDRRRTNQGQTVRIRLLQDVPRADYPDGCLTMIWADGRVDAYDRSHMRFYGWHQRDTVNLRAGELMTTPETVLECVDVGGRLASLPAFAQTLELRGDKPNTWSRMPAPTLDLYIHHLLEWSSTALRLADFFPSGTGTLFPFVLFQSQGGTLFEQVAEKASQIVPDHALTVSALGQLMVLPDPMLQELEDRTSSVQATFLEQWWSDVSFVYERAPKVHTLRANAVLTATEWTIVEGKKTLLTAFSIAPGLSPSQGTSEASQGERLARSQDDLNKVTGHRQARKNARYGRIRIAAPAGDDQGVEPALMEWVNLVITEARAAQRHDNLGSVRTLCHEVISRYRYTDDGFLVDAELLLEIETWGKPGVTEPRVPALDVGEEPPPVNSAPTITLLGSNPLVLAYGVAYSEPGATATDAEDGDLSGDLVISGDTVIPTTPGYYSILYNVMDSEGLAASTVYRTVQVLEAVGGGGSFVLQEWSGSGQATDLLLTLTHPLQQGDVIVTIRCGWATGFLGADEATMPVLEFIDGEAFATAESDLYGGGEFIRFTGTDANGVGSLTMKKYGENPTGPYYICHARGVQALDPGGLDADFMTTDTDGVPASVTIYHPTGAAEGCFVVWLGFCGSDGGAIGTAVVAPAGEEVLTGTQFVLARWGVNGLTTLADSNPLSLTVSATPALATVGAAAIIAVINPE